MGEQFCLRWNNHQNTLISVFDNLLGTETLVDCTLVAEGKFVKGHKVVLSACSPLLEMLLSQHHDKHPIVILKDVKFHELRAMMDYMYRGEVNISQDQIDMFLKAAESLQIKGLTDQGGGGGGGGGGGEGEVGSGGVDEVSGGAGAGDGGGDKQRGVEETSPLREVESSSPTPKRRRRQRRSSQTDDIDNVDTSNSCDTGPTPPLPLPLTHPLPNFTVAVTPSPSQAPLPPDTRPPVKPEPQPSLEPQIKTKTEPSDIIQPKAEYIESLNNDDSVEDLTLDDDDEYSMAQPGTSHGNSLSNQGFSSWQIGGDRSNDEVFMAAQQAINSQASSQGM